MAANPEPPPAPAWAPPPLDLHASIQAEVQSAVLAMVHPPVQVTPPPAPVVIEPLAVMEKRLILAALAETAQDVTRAAALLQINPSTVYRKLQQWKAAGELP